MAQVKIKYLSGAIKKYLPSEFRGKSKINLLCLEKNLVISQEASRNYPSEFRGKSKKTRGLFSMAIAKRKKRFYNIEIPLIGKTTQLQAYEPKDLDGKHIKYDLTRMLKGKSMFLTSKISVKNDEATVVSKEIKLLAFYLKRLARKGTSYVEDSFSTECEDAKIKIKPFLITRKKVSRKVKKALRELTKKELIKYVKNKKSEELFDEILKNQLQKPLSLKLKKIYPLSVCEIRVLKVEEFFEKPKESKKVKEKEVSKKE